MLAVPWYHFYPLPTVLSADILAQNKSRLPSLLCVLVWPYDNVLVNGIGDRGRSCMHVWSQRVLSKCTSKEVCLPSTLYSFLLPRIWTSWLKLHSSSSGSWLRRCMLRTAEQYNRRDLALDDRGPPTWTFTWVRNKYPSDFNHRYLRVAATHSQNESYPIQQPVIMCLTSPKEQ